MEIYAEPNNTASVLELEITTLAERGAPGGGTSGVMKLISPQVIIEVLRLNRETVSRGILDTSSGDPTPLAISAQDELRSTAVIDPLGTCVAPGPSKYATGCPPS